MINLGDLKSERGYRAVVDASDASGPSRCGVQRWALALEEQQLSLVVVPDVTAGKVPLFTIHVRQLAQDDVLHLVIPLISSFNLRPSNT